MNWIKLSVGYINLDLVTCVHITSRYPNRIVVDIRYINDDDNSHTFTDDDAKAIVSFLDRVKLSRVEWSGDT